MRPNPAALLLLTPFAGAGDRYEVRILGQVEFNGVVSGPLASIAPGDAAALSFEVDSEDFVDSPNFPTRGYRIDPATWSYQFPGGALPLESPYSAQELLFVIRDDDPAVDGFLVSSNVDSPSGVPLAVPANFGPFENCFYVTYGQTLLPSLDVADAVGTYDFTGLTVFNWTIDDGPFTPIGLLFEELRVTPLVDGSASVFGCGVNPLGSMGVSGGTPTVGDTLEFAVDNPLGTQAPGSIAGAFLAFATTPAFPCGLPLDGLGMGGPGSPGEVLIDTAGGLLFLPGTPWAGAGSPSTVSLALPDDPLLVGVQAFAQGLILDPLAAQGVGIGLADAVEIVVGS